jgi:cytochrome b subunit of formate dehydrogenase
MTQENSQVRYHVRFTIWQRCLHAIMFTTFLGLALTGSTLRFSDAIWAQNFARWVGGFGTILFFHKFCALLMTASFLTHVGDVGYRGLIKREKGIFWGPDSLVPQLKDCKDLYHHLRWFLWLGPQPKFDRFTYWEKFDYWAVFWGMGIIGLSGYAMWFPSFFARLMHGSWLNVALLLHGEEALLAVWFIFAIHFFNAHLRPDSFPMDLVIFTGTEEEKEMQEKRPQQYQRLLEEGRLTLGGAAPSTRLKLVARTVGTLVIVIGFILLWLTLTSFFRTSRI